MIKENIIYSDEKNFLEKLENIKKEGLENLHFLADFDNTLTKAFVNWKKTPSLVSVVRGKNGLLWEECAKKDEELFEYYYPKEIDPNIDIKQKKEFMLQWWEKSFWLFIEYWLSLEILEKIWKTDLIEFRKWIKDFLEFTNKNKIPVIIISASWLWIRSIEIILKNNNLLYPNIKIISNDFVWNKSWKAIDYKKPIIHSFNKDETVLKRFPKIYSEIKNKKNVILLWDSLWDHHMVDWFEYENLIKIWFLNFLPHPNPLLIKEREENENIIKEYKKRYDVLVLSDGSFEIVNNILSKIKKW